MLNRVIVFLFILSYSLYGETIRIIETPETTLIGTGQNIIIDRGVSVYLNGTFGTIENYGVISTVGSAEWGNTYNDGHISVNTDTNLVINGNVHNDAYIETFNTNTNIVINGNYTESNIHDSIEGAYLQMNGGPITINGNFTSNDDGNAPRILDLPSSLTVTGNFTVNGVRGETRTETGTITVQGNYTIGASGHLGVYQDLYLSGTAQQTVTIDNASSHFEKLHLENNSTAGIAFSTPVKIKNLYGNGTNISSGLVLLDAGYTNLYGVLNLGGTLTFETQLNIKENVTINGDVNNSAYMLLDPNGNLIINGNYTQHQTKSGNESLFNLSSGTATINGNCTLNGNSALPYMYAPPSSLTVTGDFTVNGDSGTSYFSTGVLEIKGDFTIGVLGQLLLLMPLALTGTDQQTVTINGTGSQVKNLTLMNGSPGGVVFTDVITVNGDLSYGACDNITGLNNVDVRGNTIVVGECTSALSPAVIVYLLN